MAKNTKKNKKQKRPVRVPILTIGSSISQGTQLPPPRILVDGYKKLVDDFTKLSRRREATVTCPGRNLRTDPIIVKHWNSYIGKGDLADWQRLCMDLGLYGDLSSKRKCRKALRFVWVNIHQFLQAKNKPDDVYFFWSPEQLAEWTVTNQCFFPRTWVPRGSPLRGLMTKFGPHQERV